MAGDKPHAQRYNELPRHVQDWLDDLSEEEVKRIRLFFNSFEHYQWLGGKAWRLVAWGFGALVAFTTAGDAIARLWDRLLHSIGVR